MLRLGVFAGVLVAMSALEALFPRKRRVEGRARRWRTNLAMIGIDTLALRVFVPVLAVGAAAWAEARGWGLFNLLGWPFWLEAALSLLLLDALIYAQHVATHRVPVLWRLHKVHHTDRDLDATSGLRFHPVEIVGSMLFKILVVLALGPAAVVVVVFEVALNAFTLFNHANLALPRRLDRALRRVLVTPDMHRIHHSVLEAETNSNYGFSLSLWDRVFGTYRAEPRDGHADMALGLAEHQDSRPSGLAWSLLLPFRSAPSGERAPTGERA